MLQRRRRPVLPPARVPRGQGRARRAPPGRAGARGLGRATSALTSTRWCEWRPGSRTASAIAALPASERFGWLVAPSSTIIQPSRGPHRTVATTRRPRWTRCSPSWSSRCRRHDRSGDRRARWRRRLRRGASGARVGVPLCVDGRSDGGGGRPPVRGGGAVDAVRAAVMAMEDFPLFNAGHGAALCDDGSVELSASAMRGSDQAAGAVARGAAHALSRGRRGGPARRARGAAGRRAGRRVRRRVRARAARVRRSS